MANELSKNEIKEIKIEQGKIDDLNNNLANQFEIIENSFVVQTNNALMQNSINGDFDEWKEKQKITRNRLKKDLKVSKENCKTIVNKSLDDTLVGVNQAISMIATTQTSKVGRANIKAIADKGISLCSDQALKNFDKSVAKVYKLRNQMPLFDAILKQTQEGIDNGLKIVYKNGRKISFKSYMEMNVRTTVRQEANEYLFKASKSNGVVFYICSSFGDCADDHKDYQGKYYYDKDYKSFGFNKETLEKIKDVIAKYNMRSYQDVVNNRPYLTTRPNCRHTLRPVVLDDIFDNKTPEDMMKQYKIKKGTYHTGNYKALQRQRYNERMIRNYKTRLENDKILYKSNPNPKLKQLIDKDEKLIDYWENEQDNLLSKYKFLKRDKRREDNKILVQDAGAGYSLGLKIDGQNMFVKGTTQKPVTPKAVESSVKVEVKTVKEEKIKVKETVVYSETYKKLEERLNEINVEYKEVKRHNTKLNEQEIIKRISGGDRTNGSCVSVGLTYIGQKLGYDVEDFRGGESCNFFSQKSNIKEIFKFIPEENIITSYAKSYITSGNRLLKNIEIGKEYYFCCGRHASIVKKTDNGILQYLELQSQNDSGWTNFNRNPRYTLSTRFGCRDTTGIDVTGYLIDIDSFKTSNDFVGILGYINTSSNNQKKGIGGFAK